jgi:DNA-binding response OmpR family regulator
MKTIVVIDDEFGLADVIAAGLSDVGYRALTAPNGVLGLEVMAEHTPDLVILDLMMPLLDGAGVLREMAKDPRLSEVPVIMVSSMPESVVRARCHGYVAFLRKPFSLDALTAAVEKALESAAG